MFEKIIHNISPELNYFMQLHKIVSLDELLSIKNENLLKMEGFGWRLMKQVLSLRKVQ